MHRHWYKCSSQRKQCLTWACIKHSSQFNVIWGLSNIIEPHIDTYHSYAIKENISILVKYLGMDIIDDYLSDSGMEG